MDRTEALRRLENSTRFQFVGDSLVVRNKRLLDVIAIIEAGNSEVRVQPPEGQNVNIRMGFAA